MANFRTYPGMFVEFTKDVQQNATNQEIKRGEVHQIMSSPGFGRNAFSFVGVNGSYYLDGNDFKPIYANTEPSKRIDTMAVAEVAELLVTEEYNKNLVEKPYVVLKLSTPIMKNNPKVTTVEFMSTINVLIKNGEYHE